MIASMNDKNDSYFIAIPLKEKVPIISITTQELMV